MAPPPSSPVGTRLRPHGDRAMDSCRAEAEAVRRGQEGGHWRCQSWNILINMDAYSLTTSEKRRAHPGKVGRGQDQERGM